MGGSLTTVYDTLYMVYIILRMCYYLLGLVYFKMKRGEKMIRVIIDSGVDQNRWFEGNYDFDFLPLSVIIENEAFLDREEISLDQLHETMKKGTLPSTSQPSPGQVREVLEKYRLQNDQVIFITLWKNFSGTYQVIKSAVDDYREEYPDFNMAIVDSNSGSVAESIIAIQALEMARAGHSFEDVIKQAQWNADNILIYLTVDKLDWLVKGGRLSKAAGYIGSALNVKPILTVDDEKLYSESMVRGNKRVYTKLSNQMKEKTAAFPNQLFCISHVGDEENAKKLEEMILKEIPEAQTMIFEFGSVLAAHIGVGGVAIAALTEVPETYILPSF